MMDQLHGDYTTFAKGPSLPPRFPTVTAAFYHHAEVNPQSIAVRDLSSCLSSILHQSPGPRDFTYSQVASMAQSLALRLHDLGVGPGRRVPLLVKRGAEMIIGILAILSCGAQYVPLDGGVVPDSTIRHVVKQSGKRLVLCLKSTEYRVRALCPDVTTIPIILPAERRQGEKEDAEKHTIDLASPEHGCYVIYTSGTTGQPKGVDVSHQNVANLVSTSPGNLDIRPGTCVASLLNISFDMAAWEIFSSLCNGGTLVMRGSKWEPALEQIDVLICTPTILSKYSPKDYPRIKTIATAGEPSSQSLADLWAKHGTYYNCCGPTETTIVNTMSHHIVGKPLSIGRPTPNNSVYILDEQLCQVPAGKVGIMWAGGHGVSRGYVGLDEKTKETFRPDPFANDGSNMYNTGDLGSWTADGSISIHGRVDDQVKVKGFRVELDGVSASLASASGVSRATALLVNDEIHGFVFPREGRLLDEEAILDHARKLQPYYALPTKLHIIPQASLTANGKLDKHVLRQLAMDKIPGNVALSHQNSQCIDSDTTTVVGDGEDVMNGTAKSKPSSLRYSYTPSDTSAPNSDKLKDIQEVTSIHSSDDYSLSESADSNQYNVREQFVDVTEKLTTIETIYSLPETCLPDLSDSSDLSLKMKEGKDATLSEGKDLDLSEGKDLDLQRTLPRKQWVKPYRGLRHRIFIVYRVLFSLMSLLNITALVATLTTHRTNPEWLATLTSINLVIAILIRQDAVINLCYTVTCSMPKSLPMAIRKRLAKIYHLGGVHSGAGVCATLWFLATAITSTVSRVGGRGTDSLATLAVSWMVVLLCFSMLASAWPRFRKAKHNLFEQLHRFVGWTTLAMFWVRTCLSVRDAHPTRFGEALLVTPGFWLLGVATVSVASSWLFLRRVKVHAEKLSDHAVRLDFDYTVPVNGTFTRLSRRPLLEWHSFATIPVPTANGNLKTSGPGYSLVVSNAGDWTKETIQSRPEEIWVRGIPTCGVMRIATLFNRVVIIATGSGIGPLLGHIAIPSCPTQLIWSTSNPEKTFGRDMIDTIHKTIPDAVIHDTKKLGRPDLVKMGYNLAKDFGAEAVIIIANEKITKKIVYGLETRGMPAYGAIWDS